jgi:DnaJ-class molecular chaperone
MTITAEKKDTVPVPPGRHSCPDCKGTGQRVAGLFCTAPGHIGPGFKVCRRCNGEGHLRGKAKP